MSILLFTIVMFWLESSYCNAFLIPQQSTISIIRTSTTIPSSNNWHHPIPKTSYLSSSLLSSHGTNNYYDVWSLSRRQTQTQTQTRTIALLGKKSDVESESESSRSVGKEIVGLAIPALAGLAIDPLMTLADTAFVGRAAENANALAGIGSASSLLTFSFYIFNFLCTATTPIVSQRRASNQTQQAEAIGGQALSLALILGLILSTALLVTGSMLLSGIMGTSNTGVEANAYALQFLNIRALAAPAIFVSSAATGILRGYLDTQTALIILLLANIVNFTLDVILIPGMGMGPTGAAIATTTAEWICALLFLGVLSGQLPNASQLKEEQWRIVPARTVPDWDDIQPLWVASSAVFLRTLSLQIALAGATAMAARGVGGASASSVAAHQIAVQLWLLGSFVCDALAAASQALVADGLGRNDPTYVTRTSQTIFQYALYLGLLLAGLLEWGKDTNFVLNFFTTDLPTQQALAPLLSLLVIAQPLNAIVFAADGVLQGASEFKYQAQTMILSVSIAIASFFTLEYNTNTITTDHLTLLHVWYALLILQLMRGITSAYKLFDTNGPIQLLSTTPSKL